MFFIGLASQRKLESEIRGQYQAVVMDTTQAEITHLSTQPEIEQWGLSQDFGTARYQDSNLIVEYADESWMVLGKKPSYVGTFPQAENEILVERAFLDYFGLPQKPGQIIRMNLGNGEQEYTISGILQAENTSRMFSVIVSRAFLEAQADGEPLFEFRFRFEGANRADLDALKADIAAFLTENDIPEALPSLRTLAKDLKISVLTVTRAYTELEQEGFVKNVQGRGCFVMGRGSELMREQLICKVENGLTDAIKAARIADLPNEELHRLLDILLEANKDD